ncbi:hypothetical protein HUA74_32830 [Myxococcus sp. CA051A]|uniref:hypothetical protein n=1 Tax=unclassified Myxococcus TaxID=2648731 RepID=UPI00157AFC4C|nr:MULTISPECIES: hypothetical protein [unclassified Myxococcus]NTX17260.1 hypothetical protein [Myxococcus sp. CA056]NTX65455.1 hypothetical protein [Myxococcus sp. CA051A]
MRHPSCLGFFVLLLSSGCERLQDEPVFVYGRLERRDGTPVSGGVVPYARTLHEVPMGEGPYVYEPPDFTPYAESTTEPSGDFFLEMRYGDVESVNTPNPWLQPYRFRASWRDETGAAVSTSFTFHDDVELPTLRIWDSQLAVTTGAEGASVTFASAPAVPVPPLTGEYAMTSDENQTVIPALPTTPEAMLFMLNGAQPLFRALIPTSPWAASRYVLEDFPQPTVMLRAVSVGEFWFFPLGGKYTELWFRMDWRTEEVPLAPGGLVPASRGATCQPSPSAGCPWTDGRLDPVSLGSKPVESLVVTLPEPRKPRHVVVRGAEGGNFSGFVLEGSEDAEQWTQLAVLHNVPERYIPPPRLSPPWRGFEEMTRWDSPFDGQLSFIKGPHFLDAPVTQDAGPVRHVRLRAVGFNHAGDPMPGATMATLAELSLFE